LLLASTTAIELKYQPQTKLEGRCFIHPCPRYCGAECEGREEKWRIHGEGWWRIQGEGWSPLLGGSGELKVVVMVF
jgi:hypothetical protein